MVMYLIVRGPLSGAARGLASAFPPLLVCLAALAVAPPAHADAGDTADALPGVIRVPVAGSIERTGVAFAGAAGYGFTEGVLREGDSHHRASGSLAASVRPTPLFAFVLRLDGRYDTHTGTEATHGWIGDPRLAVRMGGPIGHGLQLGGQVGVWLPGDSAPSWVLGSTSPDASLLATYAPDGSALTVASRVGFRWDNSASSAPSANRLARSDRLALGLNEASAALLGLGVAGRVSSRVDLLADATWDLLFGHGAPSALESPIVVSAGARVALDPAGRWQLEAAATASPSQRPPVVAGAPLVDVEPLVGGFLLLALRPAAPAPPVTAATAEPTPAPPPTPVAAAPAARASLQGRVLTEEGQAPLAHAHLTVRMAAGGPAKEADTGADGGFSIDDVDPGEATVEITAEGFAAVTRTVTLSTGAPAKLDVSVPKALPVGQVRGLVRDFAGKAVAASIRVEPLGLEIHASADGTFEANVAPGSYEIVIHAPGYADQKRRVQVERDGVTMLNVELRKGH